MYLKGACMNEILAKKIGEIMAFSIVGEETLKMGKSALEQAMTKEEIEQLASNMRAQFEELNALDKDDLVEVIDKKTQATRCKLQSMRDEYVGDEWGNPMEILEWLGFFEGAAIIHFSLVASASDKFGMADLNQVVLKGLAFHEARLNQVKKLIEKLVKDNL
jgi:hypothetical protein